MLEVIRYALGPIQTNTYLAYDSESKAGFLVDPGAYATAVTDKVKELGIDLQYIILTHGHFDHIAGIDQYKKDFPAVKIVANPLEKDMLNDGLLNSSIEMYGRPITTDADIWVRNRETMKLGTLDMTFFYTPGHSRGGMAIYIGGYCFSGDTLFRRSIGRSDFYGGDYRTMINSIKDVLFNLPDDTILLPGHMEPSTVGEEKRGNPFV